MDDQRYQGIVSAVIPKEDSGFGFIVHGKDDKEIWFHFTAVKTDPDNLHPGDKVEFTIIPSSKGFRAVGVEKVVSKT
jgi:cold shock CspA family protein